MRTRMSTGYSSHLRLAVVLVAIIFTAAVARAEERKALPVDEAGKDAAFAAFRDKLVDAVARRDVETVVARASADIQLSFGGHAGRKDFRDFLTISEDDLADEYKHEAASRREGYWDALEQVLRMGGRFTKPDTFEAPYTWTVVLKADDDPFATYFVIGADVPLRDRPSGFGKVAATLSHDIVTRIDGGEGTSFLKVKRADGVTGFVDKAQLRSPVDHRAIFEKRDGSWLMVTFIAGD